MATAGATTYPATLPQDELVHLYRFMQGPTVVSLLVDSDSPFRQIAPLLVNKLRIAAHDKIIVDFHNSTLIIGLLSSYSTARDVLESCGKVFQTVCFNNLGVLDQDPNYFAQLLAGYLAPEVSLEITTSRNPLVELFARMFRLDMGDGRTKFSRLKIRNESIYSSILLHELVSGDIKVFHFTSRNAHALNMQWEILGKSLQDLNINIIGNEFSGAGGWVGCIMLLKRHARKLTSISLQNPLACNYGPTEDELVDFYISYGAQLAHLEVGDISAKSCARIVDKCPNVQLTLQNKCNSFHRIPVLSQSLRALTLNLNLSGNEVDAGLNGFQPVNDTFNSDDEALLKKVMGKVYGLEKLTLICNSNNLPGGTPNSVIAAVFPHHMKCLKNLEFKRCSISPPSYAHVASVTSQLRSIKLSCYLPGFITAIDAIARANCGLEDVRIYELPHYHPRRDAVEAAEIIQQLVVVLSKCKMLKNIELKFCNNRTQPPTESILREIVTPLRMKAVNFTFSFSPKKRFFSTRIGRVRESSPAVPQMRRY